MSQPESASSGASSQQVELTALELHPDGVRLRLTRARYTGSVFYGPALAQLLPGAAPIRRLSHEVRHGESVRRAVWLLDSDGQGDGWLPPDALPEEVQTWVQAALAPEPEGQPHWQRRGGWAALLSWLDTELHEQGRVRVGVPQVLKDWDISFLMRVQTADVAGARGGAVYLKALPDFFRAEVRVTCTLWHELPGAAARVLAADTRRGLLLLADAGEPLIDTCSGWITPPADAPHWTGADSAALMRQLARIQRTAERLPLLGTLPDHGPEWVRGHLPKLLAGPLFRTEKEDGLNPVKVAELLALMPRLEAALERLIASPVPRTLGHGDLHKGNVLRQEHAFTLLDWSDASRTHPFLDCGPQYLVPEDQRPEAADVYLEAWTAFLPLPELRALLQDAALVGELYRVLGYSENIQPFVYGHAWDDAHLAHFRELLKVANS